MAKFLGKPKSGDNIMTKVTKQKTQQVEQKTYLLERLGSFKFHHYVKKRHNKANWLNQEGDTSVSVQWLNFSWAHNLKNRYSNPDKTDKFHD